MAKLGFYLDITKCIGCRTCQVQCKDKNRLNVGPVLRKCTSYSVGSYPDVKCFHLSMTCNHCTVPACARACPVAALIPGEDGTVQHDQEICIGCRACIAACPYEHPQFDEEKKKAVKCDSCIEIRKAGGNPACVDSCVMRALDFGDMDELKKKYGPDLVSSLPVTPDESTQPNLLLKTKECALKEGAKEMWL